MGRQPPLTFVSLGDLRHLVHSNTHRRNWRSQALPLAAAHRRRSSAPDVRAPELAPHSGTKADCHLDGTTRCMAGVGGAGREWAGPGPAPRGFLKGRANTRNCSAPRRATPAWNRRLWTSVSSRPDWSVNASSEKARATERKPVWKNPRKERKRK